MSTLTEIEAAAETLSPEEQRELFLFLAARLRAGRDAGSAPEPRRFTPERMADWVARDEADMARLRREG